MTERYTKAGRWIRDEYVNALLNIDFEEDNDRDLCLKLLNQIQNDKMDNVRLADKFFNEANDLKAILKEILFKIERNEDYCEITVAVPREKYDYLSEVMRKYE